MSTEYAEEQQEGVIELPNGMNVSLRDSTDNVNTLKECMMAVMEGTPMPVTVQHGGTGRKWDDCILLTTGTTDTDGDNYQPAVKALLATCGESKVLFKTNAQGKRVNQSFKDDGMKKALDAWVATLKKDGVTGSEEWRIYDAVTAEETVPFSLGDTVSFSLATPAEETPVSVTTDFEFKTGEFLTRGFVVNATFGTAVGQPDITPATEETVTIVTADSKGVVSDPFVVGAQKNHHWNNGPVTHMANHHIAKRIGEMCGASRGTSVKKNWLSQQELTNRQTATTLSAMALQLFAAYPSGVAYNGADVTGVIGGVLPDDCAGVKLFTDALVEAGVSMRKATAPSSNMGHSAYVKPAREFSTQQVTDLTEAQSNLFTL